MKTSHCSLRLLLTFGMALCCAPHLFGAQNPGTQNPSPQPGTPSTSRAASASPDAAAKAAERKRRFEEEEKRLEAGGQSSQTSGESAAQAGDCKSSPDDLMVSPNLVNMLVGETQGFSLFDVAGHKLTSQAVWSVSDPSTADLTVEDGDPVLTSKHTGTVRATARVGGHSAEATVNVITPEDMKPGTVRWSSPSLPCTKVVGIVQAVPH